MLKKVVKIANVGKFVACHARGDVEFRRLTLVYAENGRGKTTLCDILRSLSTGNGNLISGRSTLGKDSGSEVELLLDSGTAVFREGAWSTKGPVIEVFDSRFIHDNVYAGDSVDHGHKRNLHHVIVGEEGVRLARTVDKYDDEIRTHNKTLNAKKAVVEAHLPEAIAFDDFISMEHDPDAEGKLAEKQKQLKALERLEEIRSSPVLHELSVPLLPRDFTELLAKTLEDITPEVERRVRQHIAERTQGHGEAWIAQGLQYVDGDACPFCGQAMTTTKLLEAYRGYFSESYNGLKDSVSVMAKLTNRIAEEATIIKIDRLVAENNALCRFWGSFVKAELPALPMETLGSTFSGLAKAAKKSLDRKTRAPLEKLDPLPEFESALRRFSELIERVQAYNDKVREVTVAINAKKSEVETVNTNKVRSEVAFLVANLKRYKDDVADLCNGYTLALKRKEILETTKKLAKARLDLYSEEIIPKYQTRINKLLETFNAGFRIDNTRHSYYGGKPSSSYQIVINDVPVDLGDANTPISKPSFRNTLSAGDRSTMALAFFIAKMDYDPKLGDKLVVFDDPFTSQDTSRRTCTQQRIGEVLENARQVIVLSHEPGFLKLVWDHCLRSECRTLQLTRLGKNTTITAWSIEEDTQDKYAKEHRLLTVWVDDGEGSPDHIAKTIRPHLEGYLRRKFPGEFRRDAWLGGMIEKIRDADETSPLSGAKDIIEELTSINDYSKLFHHSSEGAVSPGPIDPTELTGFARWTLQLVGGF